MIGMRYQPQGRARVNTSHPLAAGLVDVWLPYETSRGLISGDDSETRSVGSNQATAEGLGYRITSAPRRYSKTIFNDQSIAWLVVAYRDGSTGNKYSSVVKKDLSVIAVQEWDASVRAIIWTSGNAANIAYSTTAPLRNKVNVFAGLVGPNEKGIMLNGGDFKTFTSSSNTIAPTTNALGIGGDAKGTEVGSQWTTLAVFAWQGDKLPTSAELRELSLNPWQLFCDDESEYYSRLSTSQVIPSELVCADAEQVNDSAPISISQSHQLVAPDADQANDAGAASIAQAHALTFEQVDQANEAFGGSTGLAHALAAAVADQPNDAPSTAIAQAHALSASTADQTNEAFGGSTGASHSLTAPDADQANDAPGAGVTQAHALSASTAEQANDAAALVIAQAHVLAVAIADQSNDAPSTAIAQAHALAAALVDQANDAPAVAVSVTLVIYLSMLPADQTNEVFGGALNQTWKIRRVKAILFEALAPVIGADRAFAIELPENPPYPCLVFDTKSDPEEGWSAAGRPVYTQHEITVLTLGLDLDEIEDLQPRIAAALAAIPGYMWDDGSGDAGYENDPDAYGLYQTVRIRTRTA